MVRMFHAHLPARAKRLVMMHVRVLNRPDNHSDNHDQQYDPQQEYPRRRVLAQSDSSDARPRTAIDLVRSRADRLGTRCRGATHGWRFGPATIAKCSASFIWFSTSGLKRGVGDRRAPLTGVQSFKSRSRIVRDWMRLT